MTSQCLPTFWLQDYAQYFTALLKNMRILKFKSQITFEFFAGVNHLSRPFRKQNFTLMGSKGYVLWFVIGRFWSFLCFCVSMFVACDGNYDWKQLQMQLLLLILWRWLLNFRVRVFMKSTISSYVSANNWQYWKTWSLLHYPWHSSFCHKDVISFRWKLYTISKVKAFH